MVDVAKVNLFDKTIGYVSWDNHYNCALFEYDTDFTKAGIEPAPFMMPATPGRIYSFDLRNGFFVAKDRKRM